MGAVLATAPAAGAAPPGAAPPAPGTTGEVRTVTLVTGDQVMVQNGRVSSVRPGEGREGTTFSVRSRDGHDHVVPTDAARLLAQGRLDQRLFDVTTLLELGYDDATRDTLPLIVTHPENRPAPRLAATNVSRELPSIDAVALNADKGGGAWEALTDGTTTRRTTGGIEKIWLDGKRQPTLEHSVPQIGAPTAWEAGLTGTGTTVAVLDSGVDQTHPDLADRQAAEQNFTDAPDAVDRIGHGTHVASIVAGTGAKSGGRYRGVASGARILDGKVLDDEGWGMDSWIIAGMEWAADQGADVVNMSLGGNDGEELDPVEEAVNTLSAEHGTLFVVAAGNAGPGAGTVESPSSAAAALAVGAVDRNDDLAEFSARGPRAGDGGIKPDITAPGVDIIAARHANGTVGEPVVGGYTAISGTSMAAPHVAGAAALLAQRHPNWTGTQLKAALSASARPHRSLTPFEQGAGRVDVPAALAQSIVTEPTSISLGVAAWPHDDDEPVSKELTYHNLGDTDLTLSLTTDATGPDGTPTNLFSLNTTELTIPAGDTATVTVTANTRLGETDGVYSGAVVATGPGTTTRTPLAIDREVESYNLTVNMLDQNGGPAALSQATLAGLDNSTYESFSEEDGSFQVRLPKGQYLLDVLVSDEQTGHGHLLAAPGLLVDRDLTVTMDARRTRPVRVTPPREDVDLVLGDIAYRVETEAGTTGLGVLFDDLSRISTAQVGDELPGTTLTGRVNTHWLDEDGSFYGLSWFPEGELPTGFDKVVRQQDLATVRADFGPTAENVNALRFVYPHPRTGATFGLGIGRPVPVPGARTEYFSTEGGTRWSTELVLDDPETAQRHGSLRSPATAYRAGQTYQARFNYAVFGPALPRNDDPWAYRVGDDLELNIPLFGDSSGNAGFSYTGSARTRLYRGDELLAETPTAGSGTMEGLPAEESRYRLTTTVTRPKTFDTTTSMSAEWTFSSSHVDGKEPEAIELNAVRFLPELDDNNSAPAGRQFLVPLRMQDQTGATTKPRSITVEASYDRGTSWQPVRITGNLTAVLHHPADAQTVSLRAEATDREGNTVHQTLIDAYKLRR
ncbi:hypothetical protein BU204_08565 [Actinophytocola xanthii]|uniref:Peptidase S8/S53 domain-containing protein n=1 Tax=Actinophytocola xanthii TaxID=1912961 RepID=A0A1Q8CUJ5_9PSEU|nr:hypothetical protein BU204_08565 [Actinophytocola xanthii]